MLFSYNWLQAFFNRKLPPPQKVRDLLTSHSFEVEELRKIKSDFVLDIALLPNRAPDSASHLGIARELSALLGYKLKIPPQRPLKENKLKSKEVLYVEVQQRGECPRYTARVIDRVKVAPSPKWVQERLVTCGLQPINNIVDLTNYVMLEMGQPIHAFDFDKIESLNPKSQILNPKQIPNPKSKIRDNPKKIVVRRAKKGEQITTLDNKRYDLDEDIFLIADLQKPLAIAGIKGGKRAEITFETKRVILESANFNPLVIRQGSKKLKLETDASWRFERGLDPNLTEQAIDRVAFLIEKIAGGRVWQGRVDFYPKKTLPRKIKLAINNIRDLLGIDISQKEIIKFLNSLGFKIIKKSKEILLVEIPTLRRDIITQADLIEEVGRLKGFQKIPSVLPVALLKTPTPNQALIWRKRARQTLKEAGFCEVYNYSLIGEQGVKLLGLKDDQDRKLLELENPLSSEQKYLRPSLIPNLLFNIKDNLRFFEKIKIFELGKIYYQISNIKCQKSKIIKTQNLKNNIIEKLSLTCLISEKDKKQDSLFYELKGVVDTLLNSFGISDIWYDDYKATPEQTSLSFWHQKKMAEIKVGRDEIGFIGAISPGILKKFGLEGEVFVADLDFEKILELAFEERIYTPPSLYPASVRDLAVLVPRETKVVEVLNKINTAGGRMVRDVDLFDIYEGEELPEGKKNFAFHIIYQSDKKTLTSKEIDRIHQKIIKALEENVEWEVRK